MSNKPYNGQTSKFPSSYVKQDMILSDEEEESATLAEPMTVEGAKQLAQSSTRVTPAVIPHILPVVSHSQLVASGSLHHLNRLSHARSTILHTLIPTPPIATALHGVALNSPHLVVPPAIASHHDHNLWSTTTVNDEDCNEIDNYPSTVDIGALRDSPSPDPYAEKLVTINENWNCQDEHADENVGDGYDDDGTDDDDTDSTDSDSSLASLNSVHATPKKLQKDDFPVVVKNPPFCRGRSHSESANSKSESDSKESDIDSSDGSSSDEESSASSVDKDPSGYISSNSSRSVKFQTPILSDLKVPQPRTEEQSLSTEERSLKIHEPILSKVSQKIPDYAVPVVPMRPYITKPNVHSLISTDSKRQQRLEQANAQAHATANVLQKTECLLKNVSINSNNHNTKSNKLLCNTSPKGLKSSELLPLHKIPKKDPYDGEEAKSTYKSEGSTVTGRMCLKKEAKIDLKPKPPVAKSSIHLEEKRLEKKLEMDREFDKLLNSSKPVSSGDLNVVQKDKNSYKKCIPNIEKQSRDKQIVDSKNPKQKSKHENNKVSNTLQCKNESSQKSSSKVKSDSTGVSKKLPTSVINSQKVALPPKSESSTNSPSSCLSSSDSDEMVLVKTRKRLPALMATAKIIPKKSKAKSKPPISPEKVSIPKTVAKTKLPGKTDITTDHVLLQSSVKPTIADTVKVQGRRRSFEKDRSSSEEKKSDVGESNTCDSSSSESEEVLNEKVDLDCEQTQTFSISENNFNQGRLTLKIAAMKMAKFGKRGFKEVAKSGMPFRSRLVTALSPRRSRLLQLRAGDRCRSNPLAEKHKVKTAAERKTYVDVLPVAGAAGDAARKKIVAKGDMRVPASSLYRSSIYGTSLAVTHNAPTSDDEDHISQIAHHLSQISNEHITDGLQVLDQEDLAAILPDVAPSAPSVNTSGSSFDPFLEDRGSDLSDPELSSPNRTFDEAPAFGVRNRTSQHASTGGGTTSLRQNKSAKKCDESGSYKKISIDCRKESVAEGRSKPKVAITIQKELREEENDHIVLPELESFMPLDCNASNVSPDSGIQSVNGSPLHHVGSPNHSPFYSSNIVSLSGSSVSTSYQPGNGGPSEEGVGATGSRSFSPSSSPQNYPSPPTLLPAITPPHMTSSPRYYTGSPNSPQMPSLKCELYPPLWEANNRDGPASGSESGKESNMPKKTRGRPKGSKNRKKEYKSAWLNEKEKSFKDLSDLGKKETNKDVEFNCSPLKNNWRSSAVDPFDMPVPIESSHPPKRGPGRPKKNPPIPDSSSAGPKKLEKKGHPKKKPASEPVVVSVKRPVGRPRKNADSNLKLSSSAVTPVTLASRKCFSEKIMHKIINEKVRNSEKSDKLEETPPQPEDIDKDGDSKKVLVKHRRRPVSDGIPLIEVAERRKKRGRRKELPAIFEKVYGSMKQVTHKMDKSKCTSPVTLFKRKKKKKKSFKTKHKNIIDPVFMAELEKLMVEFEKCHISKTSTAVLQLKSGEVPMPTIFRFKKVVMPTKKRRVLDKAAKASDRESGTEGEGSKEKLSGKRKKKLQEVPKQGRERSEANEQRLPLKKRHRHISTAVPAACADTSKTDPFSAKVCTDTKDRTTASKSPLRCDSLKFLKNDTKAVRTLENLCMPSNKRRLSSSEKCFSEDISMKMLDQVVPVERVKEVTSNAEEVVKKYDHSQVMVATTPKKRHRLEADLNAIGISPPASYVSAASVCAAALNLPLYTKKSPCPVNHLSIKEESDASPKLAGETHPTNRTEGMSIHSSPRHPTRATLISDAVSTSEKPALINTESSGTHSDSDIPSEHEPLCESDQSGFMSDKETTKEDDFKPMQKKLKKRKKQRLTKSDPTTCKEKQSLVKSESPVHRKKVKRRKPNKTGFPTIRKKKKKPTEQADAPKSPEKVACIAPKLSVNLEPKVCVQQLDVNETLQNHAKNEEGGTKPPHRGRGRPKKAAVISIAPSPTPAAEITKPDVTENKPVKVDPLIPLPRLRKAIPTFRNCKKRDLSSDSLLSIGENKRQKRLADDEVEDSDVFLPSEYPPSSEPASSDESSRALGKQKVPRWRKKYIIAGLFSDYYKRDEPRRNGDISGSRSKSNHETEVRTHSLLPAPLYCKKKLRETQKSFLLPYDLWWLNKHNMLPGRDIIASWNYKKVKSNVYYDVKSTFGLDVQSCNCKKSTKPDEKACGEDCINRMMFIECSPQHCPVKDLCTNQRLQRHENINCLKKFMTEEKGWGIKATAPIRQSCFIMEYVGEVVSEREFRHRMHTRYSNDRHHYCLNLDRGMMIDGHRIGSDCRFVNHSCNPNCEMQKWNVNGQYRMALFAYEDIDVGEELTYDYNFHLFNPAHGQECKCKASNCRGVIGGRSQRLNGQPVEEKKKTNGRNKKDCRKRKRGVSTDTESSIVARSQFMPIKPLSHQQRLFILAHRCFLVRNLERIRKSRDQPTVEPEKKVEEECDPSEEPCTKIQRFRTHFTALNTARSVKTRRLAQAEDDPEMTRIAKLAQIFKDIYDKLVASRDDKEKPLATPFMTLFPKKKYPHYYVRVGEPIDLSIIEKNILTGHYTTIEGFDRDSMKLFANNLRFFGRNTEIGKMAVGLRKVYSECKLQFKPLLEEVLGEDHLPPSFANCTVNEEFDDEDVIRCVCNLYRDEGTMIQCEKCLVWQHCDCMGVEDSSFPEHYLCEECHPRLVSPEVPMTPQPPDSNNKKHFVTLLRDTLQVKQGDSVYILRDQPKQKSGERRQPCYKLAKDVKYHELLIFKVESLFIDDKGDKYAFGHHFLRPHETFHEPWRKFFPNEVIRSPFCEIIALDMIIRHCWVLDLGSYCRGKPIGAVDDHIYVCEYRVDKSARVFSKISKPKYVVCRKPYAFVQYPEKLRPMRTYTPHEVKTSSKKPKLPIPNNESAVAVVTVNEAASTKTQVGGLISESSSRSNSGTRKPRSNHSSSERPSNDDKPNPLPPIRNKLQRPEKRERVNNYATRLLKLLPTKGAVDLAYLLDSGKRHRKKTTAFAS